MATSKYKEPLQVRAELLSASRLPNKTQQIFHDRPIAAEMIAQQCFLVTLLVAALRMQITQGRTLPRVGVIGGGHIGGAIVVTLLKHGYPPELLLISTRQPEKLPRCEHLRTSESQQMYQNVVRFYDNMRLAKECDIILLCMSPSQLKSVGMQIKPTLRGPNIVVSTLSGVPTEHVVNSCGTHLVVRTGVNPLDPGFKDNSQLCFKATADLLLARNAVEGFHLHQTVELFCEKMKALSSNGSNSSCKESYGLTIPSELLGSKVPPGVLTDWNKMLQVLDQLLVVRRRSKNYKSNSINNKKLVHSSSKTLSFTPRHSLTSSSSSLAASSAPSGSPTSISTTLELRKSRVE